MLVKFGNICHILDLPDDTFPMDLAVNFLQTGDKTVQLEDQSLAAMTLVKTGKAVDRTKLHPDIQRLCEGMRLVKSEYQVRKAPPVSSTVPAEFQLNFNTESSSSCCSFKVKIFSSLHYSLLCRVSVGEIAH